MHHSALFLTLAAVALGASARLNGDAQANSGNVLSPPSIAARGLDNINANLFEHNFIEATLERRQAKPDISQVGQVADIAIVADVTKLADVTMVADATTLNHRRVIDVKLRRREDIDADAHVALKRRHQDLQNIVDDVHKLIDVKLSKRADINEDVNHLTAKVQELVKLDRRLDLNHIVGDTHALINVKLFRGHEEVNAHAHAKVNLNRRGDLENIVGDARKLIDVKLFKRADINEDVNDLKNKIDSLVKLDRRDEAHKLIDVKLLRRHGEVDAHVRGKANLNRRADLENIVGDAHKLIDVKLLKRADVKDELYDLRAKVDDLAKLDRRSLNIGAVVQVRHPITVTLGHLGVSGIDVAATLDSETIPSGEGRIVKRKRSIVGTRITPRSSK